MYVPIMPLTIQLPAQENQSEFNLRRWSELQSDQDLARLPYTIETDRFGRIIMSPPPASGHTRRVARILRRLHEIFPQCEVLAETAISTSDGVKVTDAAWLSPGRIEEPALVCLVLLRSALRCFPCKQPTGNGRETCSLLRSRRFRILDLRLGWLNDLSPAPRLRAERQISPLPRFSAASVKRHCQHPGEATSEEYWLA
jgi:hypothetical protein